MKALFVAKESNTFSETIEVLGLAFIIDKVFQRIAPSGKPEILIEDKGSCFQISLSGDLTDGIIDKCTYFDFFKYIGKKSSDKNLIKFHGINYEEEKSIKSNYFKLTKEERKETSQKPHHDYDIIRMCSSIDAYNKSFNNCRLFENNFPFLLDIIFHFYSIANLTIDREQLAKKIDKEVKLSGINVQNINSLQDINPDKGKGVNQGKANGISPAGQNNFWLQQLVRFAGVWQGFVSGYVSKKDFKNYTLVPNSISFQFLSSVYNEFRKLIQSAGSIKFDIVLILLLSQKLIEHDKNYEETWAFEPINNKISGFQFAYYKSLGQRPAVTNIGFLGLPGFIKFTSEEEGNIWVDALREHIEIVNLINESHSSNITMLQEYRQFISANDFESFLEFQSNYSTYLINSLLKKQYFIKPFSIQNMEVLMGTNETYQKIILNNGFQAIAKAIRNSTIVPIIQKRNKDAIFGLSQKFKIASKDKDAFISEVSRFIQLYNERIMLKDYKNKQHQKYVTTEELYDFFKLLDEDYSAKLIAGMLIAFGFAKEPSEK
jgi:hypothetical protein